jgi:hypothetical protein
VYEASLRPWFQGHFLADATERQFEAVILTPEPAQTPHSSLVHMFGTVRDSFSSVTFAATPDSEGGWVLDGGKVMALMDQCIRDNRPVALLGTAFSFVHLLDEMKASGSRLTLPAGSRVFETGGYKGRSRSLAKEELRRWITRSLGVPQASILSEYGMSELSSQAYDGVVGRDSEGGRRFEFPPWARTRLVSPETGEAVAEGEAGLVQIYDLANVRSILAIQTEDVAIRRGDGFEWVGRAAEAEPRGCSLMPAEAPRARFL